jgi:hypothetical protein
MGEKKIEKYNIGDIVFLVTDKEQIPRQITGILQRPYGFIYYLSNNTNETTHYDIEFSRDINILTQLI